jgi:hypothetical protein
VIDWHIYNELLVRRGEVVLDFDVIDNWNNELDNMPIFFTFLCDRRTIKSLLMFHSTEITVAINLLLRRVFLVSNF